MKVLKNGFTLAEMLICLGLIAAVVAIMIPAVTVKKPNKNRALFRKSYYNFERIISELVNEEEVFPSTRFSDFSADEKDPSTLFAYFIPELEERKKPENMITVAGSGQTLRQRSSRITSEYLCSQIAERMNTNGLIDCTSIRALPADNVAAKEFPTNGDKNSPNFVTNDGVAWFTDVNADNAICAREIEPDGTYRARGDGIRGEKPENDKCNHKTTAHGDLEFPITKKSDYVCYELDVNGPEKPNCRQCDDDPDRFRICVTFEGKIEVPKTSGHEAEYLQTNNVVE